MSVEADIDYCINMLESLKGIADDKESLALTIKLFEKRYIKVKTDLGLDNDNPLTVKEDIMVSALKVRDINSLEDRKQIAHEFIEAFKAENGESSFEEGDIPMNQECLNIRADSEGNFYESMPGCVVDNTPNGRIVKG